MRNEVRQIDGVYYFPRFVNTVYYKMEQEYSPDHRAVNKNFDKSILSSQSDRLMHTIHRRICSGDTCMYVLIDDVILYKGFPDYTAALTAALKYFEEKEEEQDEADKLFYMHPTFRDTVVKYLAAVMVLISPEANMNDIIYQRDKYYGETDEILRCIKGIRNMP